MENHKPTRKNLIKCEHDKQTYNNIEIGNKESKKLLIRNWSKRSSVNSTKL